jgi:hypothetical protein
MKCLTLLLSTFIVLSLNAQDCDPKVLEQKPGVWKAGIKNSAYGVSAADLPKEKQVMENIHKLVSTNYSPIGCQALYSLSHDAGEMRGKIADAYNYTIYVLRYLCDPGSADKSKSYVDISTTTVVYVSANAIYSMSTLYSANLPEDDMRGYLPITRFPQKKDGYWFIGDEVVGDSHREYKIREHRWLITYGDELPFEYVSRKEFLLIQKKRLEKTIQESKSTSGFYDKYMRNINEALKKSDAELSKPAISIWNDEERFEKFVEEGTLGSFIAVRPNLNYYKKNLSKAAPQFFSVVYKFSEGVPVFQANIAGIQKALDFSALRNMLGKEPVKNAVASNPPAKTPETATKVTPKSDYNIYKNVATKGFKETPATQLKNVATLPAPVDSKIKTKALSTQLTTATVPTYLNQLLGDVEKNITPQQAKNTQLIYAKLKASPVDLADLGVMLYYKGAVNESLWCLSKAAALKPNSDYILSNLTGIMNLAQAEARALPLLRYLKNKRPNNTTILNNLGQALYRLGELNASKDVLDSCIKIFAYHPQANFTRAIIAEKQGKNADAANFIIRSMKVVYSNKSAEFAQKKAMNVDYSNLLNLYRPTSTEYINPKMYRPPAQCESVFTSVQDEALWDEWNKSMLAITGKINAALAASSENFQKQLQQQAKNPTSNLNVSIGPMHDKAQKLYKVFMDKAAALQEEAQFYAEHKFKNDVNAFETAREEAFKRINKKYADLEGEGKGSYSDARCSEINSANSLYLLNIAGIKNEFNNRFVEPLRDLNIEMMYWSQFLAGNTGFREGLYYERALFAVNPGVAKSIFIQPCETNTKGTAKKRDEDLPSPYCPISFKFKVVFAKLNGDCNKFEVELEFEGLVLNLERDFVNKKSTIAFGYGASLDLSNKEEGVSKNEKVPEWVPEIVDMAGGGVGVKMQGFIEFGEDGVSDIGLRGEAAIEGMGTDKGDLKINGKIGVNSGVEITPSPAVENIGKALNEAFAK